MPAPHTLTAEDILNSGPVESLAASRSGGSRARKRFSIVTDLESGMISYRARHTARSADSHSSISTRRSRPTTEAELLSTGAGTANPTQGGYHVYPW